MVKSLERKGNDMVAGEWLGVFIGLRGETRGRREVISVLRLEG